MKRIIILIFIVLALIQPVSATEFEAPQAPAQAQLFMPQEPQTFGEGLLYILREAIARLHPAIADASAICAVLTCICLSVSLLEAIPGANPKVTTLVGSISVATVLFQSTNAFIHLGSETVTQLSEYAKLLLPVMTAAVTAQGGASRSAAIYAGTAMFDALLCHMIASFIVPMMYIYLCACIAGSIVKENALNKLCGFIKWAMTWSLKLVLYVFTGYITVTGVISGTADAAAVKAAKLTISGVVPVVGGILSDASETVLISAGIVKNSVGIYGLLAMIAIWIGPFIQIGIQYLMLKITVAVCSVFTEKQPTKLLQDFSGTMGLILAMTGTVCLLLLISMVCFMKGAI